jgi:hypothetical protein
VRHGGWFFACMEAPQKRALLRSLYSEGSTRWCGLKAALLVSGVVPWRRLRVKFSNRKE